MGRCAHDQGMWWSIVDAGMVCAETMSADLLAMSHMKYKGTLGRGVVGIVMARVRHAGAQGVRKAVACVCGAEWGNARYL